MVMFYVAMVTHLGVLLGIDGLTAIREPHCLVSVMVAHLCVRVWVCVGGMCVCVCGCMVCACVGVGDVCVCLGVCMYVILPLNTTCTTAVHNNTSHHQLPIKFTFRYFQHTHCNHGNTPVGTRHIMNTGVTYECHTIIKFQKIDTFPNDYHILGNFRGKKFFA